MSLLTLGIECKAVYYPNYVARDDVRQYYPGIPDFIQVSNHKYVERAVLEHFTMLSVLSWTSATNAAHIYAESMAKLSEETDDAHFRLRACHTSDGLVILGLLRDTEAQGSILEVPHDGHQSERFNEAMRRRNDRIRRAGQPEYAHWCTKCMRRFNDADGVARMYLLIWGSMVSS